MSHMGDSDLDSDLPAGDSTTTLKPIASTLYIYATCIDIRLSFVFRQNAAGKLYELKASNWTIIGLIFVHRLSI